MRKITLDHNCILAIENGEDTAYSLRKIVNANNVGRVTIAVLGISASERTSGGGYITDISEFHERLKSIDLQELKVLKPVGVWGVTFWNWAVYSSAEDQILRHKIHSIMFPGDEPSWQALAVSFGEELSNQLSNLYRKWRNRHCDVQGLWAHINDTRDIFVTSDKHFLNRLNELKALGSKEILSPDEALMRLNIG